VSDETLAEIARVNAAAKHGVRPSVSIMTACELVGVSRRTIYNWLASGKVDHCRTAGGCVRIFVDSLWRYDAATGGDRPIAAPAIEMDRR
jgi:excisionase family DNA binding protein